jgi:hypothetical protein
VLTSSSQAQRAAHLSIVLWMARMRLFSQRRAALLAGEGERLATAACAAILLVRIGVKKGERLQKRSLGRLVEEPCCWFRLRFCL